jgi:hypothetical protein
MIFVASQRRSPSRPPQSMPSIGPGVARLHS